MAKTPPSVQDSPRARWAAPARTLAAAVLLAGCAVVAHAQKEQTREPAPGSPQTVKIPLFGSPREFAHKLKFLVSMARFTEWPSEAFSRADSPIIIGVVGPPPSHHGKTPPPPEGAPPPPQVRAFEKHAVGGRPIIIHSVNRLDDMRQCHVLYFPAGLDRKAMGLMRRLKDLPIVTVGEFEEFARAGGMVELGAFTRDAPPSFEVNVSAAQRSKINFSSRMLSIASRVHREADR